MVKKKASKNGRWTEREDKLLKLMVSNSATYKEMAEKLGCEEKRVSTRIHYLRQKGEIPAGKRGRPSVNRTADSIVDSKKPSTSVAGVSNLVDSSLDNIVLNLNKLRAYINMLEAQNDSFLKRLAEIDKILKD